MATGRFLLARLGVGQLGRLILGGWLRTSTPGAAAVSDAAVGVAVVSDSALA